MVTLLGKVAPDPNPEAPRDPRLAIGLSNEPGNTVVVMEEVVLLMLAGVEEVAVVEEVEGVEEVEEVVMVEYLDVLLPMLIGICTQDCGQTKRLWLR